MLKNYFLGSSCIYPEFSPQPIREEYLLSSLESTNEWYIAKIAGVKVIAKINTSRSFKFNAFKFIWYK